MILGFSFSTQITPGDAIPATIDVLECLRLFHKYDYEPGLVCTLVQMADPAHQQGNVQRACRLCPTG